MKVLVTGARGFIGQAVCSRLTAEGYSVIRAVRKKQAPEDIAIECADDSDWKEALSACDAVIHLAAQVRARNTKPADALASYRSVNVDGTRNLAEQAVACGIKRFVHMSSIKVNGERTKKGEPFTSASIAAPEDSYGLSKWEAEQALRDISRRTGLETVILRPPLVYGPGVKANMANLVGLARRGLPLPFGSIDNRRSFLGLSNLADLVLRCVEHPAAAGQTFLASDGKDLSTPKLIECMAKAMNKRTRFLPLPVDLLRFVGRLTGTSSMIERLTELLQIDAEHTRRTLDWAPRFSVEEEMARTVKSVATLS